MRVGHWESPADPKAIPKIWRVMQGDGSGWRGWGFVVDSFAWMGAFEKGKGRRLERRWQPAQHLLNTMDIQNDSLNTQLKYS